MNESQPQEWTPQKVKSVIGVALSEKYPSESFGACFRLSQEINAELAAELEKISELESRIPELEKLVIIGCEEAAKNIELKTQLLQAQAAIAAIVNSKNKNELYGAINQAESVDLSALDKHDEEVRRPLVEALEKIAQSDGIGGYELANIAADALALR